MSLPRPLAGLALILAALLALLLGLACAAPLLVRYFGEQALHEAGFEQAVIAGVSLRSDGIAIGTIDLAPGGALRLSDLRLQAGIGDLLDGRIRKLVVGKLRLDAALDADGRPEVPGFTPPGGAAPAAAMSDLPFERLEIAGIDLTLATPAGLLQAGIDGLVAEIAGTGAKLAGALGLAAPGMPEARLAGPFAGTLDLAGIVLDLGWSIERGAVRTEDYAAAELSGRIDLRRAPGAQVEIDARLATPEMLVAGRVIGRLSLVAGLRGTALEARIDAPDHGRGTIAFDLAGLAGRLTGDIAEEITADGVSGRVSVTFDLALDLAAQPAAVVGDLDLAADGLAMDGRFSDGTATARLAVSGSPERLAIVAREALRASLLPAPALWPDAFVTWRGERLLLDLDGLDADLDLSASSVRLGGRLGASIGEARLLIELAETPLRLEGDGSLEAPSVALSLDGLDWQGLRFDFPAIAASLVRRGTGSLAMQAGGRLVVDGEAGGIRLDHYPIDWSATGVGTTTLALDFTAGDLDLPAFSVHAIAGRIAADAQGLASATLGAGDFRLAGDPAPLAPLAIDAKVTRDGDRFDLEMTASDPLGIVIIEALGKGTMDAGEVDLQLYPLHFFPDATGIADLSPLLGARLTGAQGTLGFTGHIGWQDGSFGSHGRLTIGDFSARLPEARLIGVETAIEFESLLPPRTAGVQKISIRAIEAGVLLADGRVGAALDGSRLKVEEIRFSLADGDLAAEPFAVNLASPGEVQIVLTARGVDLAGLFRLAGVNGLEGEGRVSGRVPLVLSGGDVRIEGGMLEAAGGGLLRYIPETLPAFLQGDDVRAQMLREALKNFRYEELSLALGGDLSGGQQVQLFARGSNPDFLDGHPIELKLGLGGALLGAARSAGEIFGEGAVRNLPPPR